MSDPGSSSSRGSKFSKKKGGKHRSTKPSRTSDHVQESTEDNRERLSERSTTTSPLLRQVSSLSVRDDEPQEENYQLVPYSARENRQVSVHQQERERVEYSSRYSSRGGSNAGFYSVRGFSANSTRGQFLCFNCFTTVPLSLQFTPTGVNMDVPNGYMNSRFRGAGNQGQGNQRQTVQHHQTVTGGQGGLPGSAQTVNHGTNFFSFFFVNSGAYDLNFTGNGFPGLGGQPTAPPPQPPTASSTGMFAAGAPFPAQQPHHQSSCLYVTAPGSNTSGSPSPIRPVGPAFPNHQPTPYPAPPYTASSNCGSYMDTGFHQGPSHMTRSEDQFHHYRQRDPSYPSFSQRSMMDNFEEVFDEDQEGSCSQCSTKSASNTGCSNRFNGYQ